MHESEVDAVDGGKGFVEDFAAADDEDFGVGFLTSCCNGAFEIRKNLDAGNFQTRLARDDDVSSLWQRFTNGVVSFSPHDNCVIES